MRHCWHPQHLQAAFVLLSARQMVAGTNNQLALVKASITITLPAGSAGNCLHHRLEYASSTVLLPCCNSMQLKFHKCCCGCRQGLDAMTNARDQLAAVVHQLEERVQQMHGHLMQLPILQQELQNLQELHKRLQRDSEAQLQVSRLIKNLQQAAQACLLLVSKD